MMNTPTIRALLTADFAEIVRIAQAASLSQKSMDRIEKAKRSTDNMVTAVADFKVRVDCEVRKLDVDNEIKEIIKKHLIPKAYFDIALPKQQKDNIKDMMKVQIKRIDEELKNNPTWGAMSQKMQDELINYSEDLAQLFQRSSSSLEGRNNQLKYHVRSLHHLNQNRLSALTCIANFSVKRPDGTTAAERFFGKKPTDLFSFLLSNLPYCARPAQKRS